MSLRAQPYDNYCDSYPNDKVKIIEVAPFRFDLPHLALEALVLLVK